MAGFSSISSRDFTKLAESWGFAKEEQGRGKHPALVHPESPDAKVRYTTHGKGRSGGTVPFNSISQAQKILGLPDSKAFLEGPEKWRQRQADEARAAEMYALAVAVAEADAGEGYEITDCQVLPDGSGLAFTHSKIQTNEETAMPAEPFTLPAPEPTAAEELASVTSIFKCPECGAEAAQNGNPFSSHTLNVHRAASHGKWVCPECDTAMTSAGKGSHQKACNAVAPTTKIPCGLCGNRMQKRSLASHLNASCGTVRGWRTGTSTPGVIEDAFTRSLVQALPDWELLSPTPPPEPTPVMEVVAPAWEPEYAEPFPTPAVPAGGGIAFTVENDEVVAATVTEPPSANAAAQIDGTVDAALDLFLGEFPRALTMSQQRRLAGVRTELVALLTEASLA